MALALAPAARYASAQPPAAQTAPKDQMFSGVVMAVAEGSVTATRIGSKETKVFTVTAETKFEGPKPQVNSRVTVRYVTGEDGDRAIRIIVRAPAKK